MFTSALDKTQLLHLTEWDTVWRRLNVKLHNDWRYEDRYKRRLIVNHEYRFIYCPIHKNASTSMLAALFQLAKGRRKKALTDVSDLQIRTYISLNHSLSNYTYASATDFLSSDYFKFTIVRNPWARLVSTYANYFVRLPLEKHTVSKMAKVVASYEYGDEADRYLDKITFEQFVKYVFAKKDNEINPHCVSQTQYLAEIGYDYIAKMENLNLNLLHIREKLKLPIELGRKNKTAYSASCDDYDDCYNLTPSQIRNLEGGIPLYKKFYNSELVEMVRQRYTEDIEKLGYDF